MYSNNFIKYYVLIFILILIGVYNKSFADSSANITTPNGKPVQDAMYLDEMSQDLIDSWNEWANTNYPNASFCSDASRTYNCHGFAWYTSETGINVWIGTYGDYTAQNVFWIDLGYVEVQSDLIDEKISYQPVNANHSAITTETSGVFKSKWGLGPLMEHQYYDCPYWPLENDLKYYKHKEGPGNFPISTETNNPVISSNTSSNKGVIK